MGGTVFVDESKHRGYFLVASVHLAGDLDELRKLMRGLVLPGQRRVHMSKERDSRRREIAAVICRAAVTATIYDAQRHHPRPSTTPNATTSDHLRRPTPPPRPRRASRLPPRPGR